MMMGGMYLRKDQISSGPITQYLRDLVRYRHLCLSLVRSDMRSRFRRSYVGSLWAILQPLAFSAILGYVLHIFFGQAFAPYFMFVLTGFVVWDVVVASINGSLPALETGGGFLMQARIPLFVFQARVSIGALINFGFGSFAVVVGSLLTGTVPVNLVPMVQLIPFVILLLAFSLPLTILFSIIGVQFRDANHIVPLAVQLGFLTAPVILPREVFEQPQLAFIQYVNPATPLLDLFRDPMLHGAWWSLHDVVIVVMWIAGLWATALITARLASRRVIFHI